MKFLRILVSGWTASFRYPAFISGFQPTLPVPPLSTIYGLLSAIKGDFVTPKDMDVGFIFDYDAKSVDLETIYELKGIKGNKSNVIKREFLFNPKLFLYISDLDFKKYLHNPYYPIVLGRSSDLAFIEKVDEVNMELKENVKLGKTILPIDTEGAFGIIQALPTHFSDSIPRKSLGTRPFILMDDFFEYSGKSYYDEDLKLGVWIHKNE
jgi:CRISPR-associated protein Cas5t